MEKERRERGKNFTEKEKEVAVAVIKKYQTILDNKATDGCTQKHKTEAWEQVAEEYNSTSVSAPRTSKQLKVLWSNLRRSAKKTVAEENKKRFLDNDQEAEDLLVYKQLKVQDKKNRTKTGGGECSAELSEVGARVLAMVETQIRPLSNMYDDNNIYHGDLVLSPTRGAIVPNPISDLDLEPVNLDIEPMFLEPVPGPSHQAESPATIPTCENPPPVARPRVIKKKYIPPKQSNKRSTLQLKRTLYLKRIKWTNLEIKYKEKLYKLELKIKEKELEKLVKNE